MIQFVEATGVLGLLAVAVTLFLLFVGGAVVLAKRSRRLVWLFFVLALLPVEIGLLGTVLNYARIADVLTAADEVATPGIRAAARAQARYSTWLGLGCTVLLWLVGAVLIAITRKPNRETP